MTHPIILSRHVWCKINRKDMEGYADQSCRSSICHAVSTKQVTDADMSPARSFPELLIFLYIPSARTDRVNKEFRCQGIFIHKQIK
jgi:hypothetical protein